MNFKFDPTVCAILEQKDNEQVEGDPFEIYIEIKTWIHVC